MPDDTNTKNRNVLWWIASIATSVMCCSILFVLFASYIVDIKSTLEETSGRINIIQLREEKILAEIEMIRKRVGKETGETKAPEADAAAPTSPVAAPLLPLSGASETPEKMPEITPPSAPTSLVPVAQPVPTTVGTTAPVSVAPVPVPAVPASTEKK
ncbi:MAG: hypothetical protein PHW76_09680 [Alphaproteobacteria bacterium]|nr:hypothetical protein [Alphaproteobacteria bacterium]